MSDDEMNNIWLDDENIRQFGKTNEHEESHEALFEILAMPVCDVDFWSTL